MRKKFYYDEDYDSDNPDYDDEDDYDEYDTLTDYDEETDDDMDEDDEDDDSVDSANSPFSAESTMGDLGGKKNFDPSEYDFQKIMEDYHSGIPSRKEFAINQAAVAMDALVKHVINRHYPTYREKYYDDMLQEGRMAVIDTLGGYTGKCAPSSYFYTTIRHQIQVFIAEHVHRTTRHYAAMANKIRKAELALSQIDGKDYHDDPTIAVYTGLPLTTVMETRKQTAAADFVTLHPNIDTDESAIVDYGNPAAAYWEQAKSKAIIDAINRLEATEAQIIKMLFGLDGYEVCNAPEVGRRLHLKTEQVRKISQDACRKLSHDKKLAREIDVHDKLAEERRKSSMETPFVSVEFGHGENFFDEISEDSEIDSEENIDPNDLFKSIDFDNLKKNN